MIELDTTETIEVMQDFPGADNHGRKTNSLTPGERHDMDGQSWPARQKDLGLLTELDFISGDGDEQVTVFNRKSGWEHGMHAHRGLLTEDEEANLDPEATIATFERMLGLPAGFVERAYGDGQQALATRHILDQRILALVEDGASSHLIARVLGWRITDKGCQRMRRLLVRARRERQEAAGC